MTYDFTVIVYWLDEHVRLRLVLLLGNAPKLKNRDLAGFGNHLLVNGN